MLNTIISGSLTIETFLICTAVSLVLGIAGACLFMFRNTYSKSFVLTLAVMPAIVLSRMAAAITRESSFFMVIRYLHIFFVMPPEMNTYPRSFSGHHDRLS